MLKALYLVLTPKQINKPLHSFSFRKLTTHFALALFLFIGCGTPYQPKEEEPKEGEQQEIKDTDSVPADGTLETVTWNLEWYGSGFSGPPDFEQQTKNILRVVDSLNADLYAFQEVNAQNDLNKIVGNMPGYRGFVAEHVGQSQKMAFVFNTKTIDSLSSGSINNVREKYKQDWNYYWAGGRTPLYFSFDYSFEGTTEEFYAIVIHGKANTGDSDEEYREAYERRKKAAEGLYYYLKDNKPEANVILLGDYNDDVDQSIYYDSQGDYAETPYYQFVNDDANFDVLSKVLSDSGVSASVNYKDIIDHITVSDELFDNYVQNSTAVYQNPQSYIQNYGQTTSDHLPVWAKFNVTKSKALAK